MRVLYLESKRVRIISPTTLVIYHIGSSRNMSLIERPAHTKTLRDNAIILNAPVGIHSPNMSQMEGDASKNTYDVDITF